MKPHTATESVRIDKQSYAVLRRRARSTGRTIAGTIRVMILTYESFFTDGAARKN